MAQALVELSYYKCGHCLKTFDSLPAFGKHQKEKHTPANAPRKTKQQQQSLEKLEEKQVTDQETKKPPHLQFALEVKLCKTCVDSILFCVGSKKLEIPLCNNCLERNGLV